MYKVLSIQFQIDMCSNKYLFLIKNKQHFQNKFINLWLSRFFNFKSRFSFITYGKIKHFRKILHRYPRITT